MSKKTTFIILVKFYFSNFDGYGYPVYQTNVGSNNYYLHFYDEGIFYDGFWVSYVQYIKNLRTFLNTQSLFPNDIIPPFFKTNSQLTFFIQNVISPFMSEKNYFLHAKMTICYV